MLEILFSWLSIPRTIGIWIDSIAFGLVDNIYDLIYAFASATFFEESMILTIMNNTYIAISIFALFRIALILVNAMINPDKLSDKENGLGSVLRNLVVMFVLLIFTPLLFREANYIQSKVVEGNYIQKIFLPDNAKSENPGTEMKKIAMGALVHPDDAFATYDSTTGLYTPKDTCTGKCETAVSDYNTMMQSDAKGMFSVFTKHIGRTEKVDEDGDGEKETVYVYTYMFIVTFVVGCFITYILFTFGLDIAIRAVELAVLQMIAPLFIVTYIDPKSAKTGPFHNWLKTVGKTYASLFIKLAILSLMIMFISLIDQIKVSDNVGFIGKLVILLAILIFAKKAPKWIGDMIGVDGESSGLGGLGKKLGSAALVGGALTKAGHAAAGAVAGGAVAAHNQLRNRRQGRRDAANSKLPNRFGLGKDSRQARKDYYKNAGLDNKGYFKKRHELAKNRRQTARNDDEYGWNKDALKKGFTQLGASMVGGTIAGGKAGIKGENIKGVLSGASNAANQFGKQVGLKGEGIGARITGAFDSAYTGVKGAYGTAADINKRIKDAEDAKNFDAYFSSKSGFKSLNSVSNTPVGQGDFNKAFQGAIGGMDAVNAAIGAKCNPQLKDATISTDKDGIITVSNTDGSYSMKIDGSKGTIIDSNGASHDFNSMRDRGQNTFTNEGLANYENMFAEAQRQAISSTIGNNTQMSALMQQRSNAEQSISYNTGEAMKIVAGAGLVINGEIAGTTGPVKLAEATMADLKYAMSEAQKKSPGKYDAAASEVEKRADSCDKSGNIINNINTQIGYYEESNAKLGNMIATLRNEEKDGVKENQTKTLDELLVIAEKNKEKKQKAVDAFEQQKSDEKK